MKKILKKKGFTLIELIVVITILGILVAIAVPSILNYITQANDAVAAANLRTVKSEIGLDIATNVTADSAGTAVIVHEGKSYDCDWTAGSFPAGFTCTVTVVTP
jgi:type IV pilus assembly protein PilA